MKIVRIPITVFEAMPIDLRERPSFPWPRPFANEERAVAFAQSISEALGCTVVLYAHRANVVVEKDDWGRYLLEDEPIVDSDGQYTEKCCEQIGGRADDVAVREVRRFKDGKKIQRECGWT